MSAVILCFVILSLNFILNSAAQCQDFHSFTPWLAPTSVCGSILPMDYQVYVENDTCLQSIEQNVASGFPSSWFPLSNPCRTALSKYQCIQAFPGCELDQGIAKPKYPCQDICADVDQHCNGFDKQIMTLMNGIQLNCSSNSTCQTVPPPTLVPVPQCEAYQGSVCAGVIDYPIYIPPPLTQAYLEAQLVPLSRALAIAPQENDCQKHAAAFYCSQAFMRCDTNVIGRALPNYASVTSLQIPFPRYPCKSICLDYNATCTSLFALNSALVPNCESYGQGPDAHRACNGTFLNKGQDNFPTTETIFSNQSGLVFATECNPLLISSFSASAAAFSDCPFPLVQPEDYSKVDMWVLGSCALPCPIFTSTKEENRLQDLGFTITSWMSAIYLPIVAIPYLIFPHKKRHFHIANFLAAVSSVIAAALGGIFKGLPKGDPKFLDLNVFSSDFRCINNAMAANVEESTLCGYIFFLNTIGNIAGSCWWLIIAFDVFYQIVLEKRFHHDFSSRGVKLVAVIYGWGLPLLLTIIARALGDVKATGSWNCAATNSNVIWGAVTAVPIANVASGCVLMAMTFRKVIQVGHNVGRIPKEAARLIVLLLVFLFSYGFAFIGEGILYQMTDSIAEAAQVWLTCLLVNSGAADPISICGKEPTTVVPVVIFRGFMIETGLCGVAAALLFTDRNVFRSWKYFFSGPNRCSLQKMVDFSNLSIANSKKQVAHNKTSTSPHSGDIVEKSSLELANKSAETSLLPSLQKPIEDLDPETKPMINTTEPIDDTSPLRLFNPFLDSPSKEVHHPHSTPTTPTKEPVRQGSFSGLSPPLSPSTKNEQQQLLSSLESSRSVSAFEVDGSTDTSTPVFFPLPPVSEQIPDENSQTPEGSKSTEINASEDTARAESPSP